VWMARPKPKCSTFAPVLTALDEYRQLSDLMARAQRKVAKTSKDLAGCLKDDLSRQQQDRDAVCQ
jgi:hypothetical protein